MGNITRKNFIVDEQRITSIELDKTKPESCNSFTIRSQLFAYFWTSGIKNWKVQLELYILRPWQKETKIIIFDSISISRFNRGQKLYKVHRIANNWTAFHAVLSTQTKSYESEIDHLLVPKF